MYAKEGYSLLGTSRASQIHKLMDNTSLLDLCRNRKMPEMGIRLLNGMITPLLVILGCLGNSYSLLALKKINLNQDFRLYLIVLTLWDSCVLICALGFVGFPSLLLFLTGHHNSVVESYLRYYFHGPIITAITGSTWMTVVIAVARYKAISKPFQSRTRITNGHQLCSICAGVAFCAFFYCSPCYVETAIVECIENKTGKISKQLTPAYALFGSRLYLLLYRTISYTTFVSVGPFLLIILLSGRLLLVLHRRKKASSFSMSRDSSLQERPHKSSGGEVERSELLTAPFRSRCASSDRRMSNRKRLIGTARNKAMILIASLLGKFLICNLLPTFLMFFISVVGVQILREKIIKTLFEISNFLIVLNSATNFLIYSIWWRKPRRKPALQSTLADRRKHADTPPPNVFLTRDETQCLLHSWGRMSVKDGKRLFVKLLMHISESDQNVSTKLGFGTDNNNVQQVSISLYRCLNNAIQQIAVDPSDFPHDQMRQLGAFHFRSNIHLSNSALRDFKKFILSEIFNTRKSTVWDLMETPQRDNSMEEFQIWNSFLSMLIRDVKEGYMNSTQHAGRYVSTNL